MEVSNFEKQGRERKCGTTGVQAKSEKAEIQTEKHFAR